MIRWVLRKPMEFVLYRPVLASHLVKVLTFFPFIHKRLIAFASNEGLITHSHAPVPRKPGKATENRVLGNLAQQLEIGAPVDFPSQDQTLPGPVRPKGKNHELKSPLEKWFH